MLNHLVCFQNISADEINQLIKMAQLFKKSSLKSSVIGKTVVMMFFENSTRTKCSFDLAAQKLGLNVLHFDVSTSSFKKGESVKDTLENLYFIGADAVVIRHAENNIIQNAIKEIAYPIKFINAGMGNQSHPTQALLDYMTMLEKIGNVKDKKITIVGDISHSRVAKSNIELLNKFGANVNVCAPKYFEEKIPNTISHTNMKEAIENADVVMMLRVQKERHEKMNYSFTEYANNYQLTAEVLEKYAPNAILMHPGPVNRDVEIASDLLDSEKGKTILQQAQNGVFVRMAVMNTLLRGEFLR